MTRTVPDIIEVLESRRMRWAGHIVRMVEKTFGGENLKERHHLEDLSVDGRIILEWK